MSQSYSRGNQNIFHLTSTWKIPCTIVQVCRGVHSVSQGIPTCPCALGYDDCLKAWHSLCTSPLCSCFYIMPTDMLSEFFFACVTHLKCHFIYGYWIAQSFICSWLHLFVAWLKWMHLRVYIKSHLSLWAGIWRKAAKCTFQYYFSFFDILFQHQIEFSIFFSKKREDFIFMPLHFYITVWIK